MWPTAQAVGSASPPSPPSPLPHRWEWGAGGGVRAPSPRAGALGYHLPPLTGLRRDRPHEEDFVSELLTQDTNGASPEPDEHVMMPSNLRRDSAWGKAHHFGTTSRTSCDHTLAPVPGTSPYKATAASRIEPASAESQHSRRPLSVAKGRTVSLRSPPQNLTHLHQVSYFKISRDCSWYQHHWWFGWWVRVLACGTGPRRSLPDQRRGRECKLRRGPRRVL